MELADWLVVIGGAAGVLALLCLWLALRVAQLKERVLLLARHGEEKSKLAQDAIKLEFRNTANALFEEVSRKLSTQSEKKIGDLLSPLQQRIAEFQKKVDDSFGAHGKEQHTLKAEITRIVDMNEKMRQQTESLTKALRGDSKAQGNWGEVMLERILDESGLVKGSDYIVQAEEMGLKGAEGNRLRPDVIVNLPDGKHIIIDSKVSLTAYDRYCATDDDAARQLHVSDFLSSLKNHIVGLEKKRYQDIEKLQSPDFVFMFVPLEGAYSLAVQQNTELHTFAWNRKIALVCPSTLFASLVTIASLWRIDRQNKNAQDIAQRAGYLYDKFLGFLTDMQDIGDKIARSQAAYENAMGKLSSGRGNVVARVEQLKTMGATTTKSLPKELLHTAEAEEA